MILSYVVFFLWQDIFWLMIALFHFSLLRHRYRLGGQRQKYYYCIRIEINIHNLINLQLNSLFDHESLMMSQAAINNPTMKLLFLILSTTPVWLRIQAFQLPTPSTSRARLFSTTNENGSTSAPASSAATASSNKAATYQRELRAGEEGYSLLRRPVTFDDSDPIFEAPKSLIDDDSDGFGNRSWFDTTNDANDKNVRTNITVGGDFTSPQDGITVITNTSPKQQRRQQEQDQYLNMHARTLETLDYRFILKALSEQCSTLGGQRIVWDSVDLVSGGLLDGANTDSNDTATIEEDVATMALTATTLEGVHRRYNAVKEMTALMEGRVTGWITPIHSKQSQQQNTNNNKTAKKKVTRKPLGRPPIENVADLQPILDALDKNQVLEGVEILQIAELMECCQEVLDWGEALEVVNEENEEQMKQQQTQGDVQSLQQPSFIELLRLANAIEINEELYHLLSNAFDDTGKLSGTTFPTIGLLRSKVRTLKQSILSSIDTLLSTDSIQNKLAVESGGALTMEINGRIVIPLQSQYQNMGIVHDASRSGKTCYVEPREVVGPTNELRAAEAELRSEEIKVWRELTECIIKNRDEIVRNDNILSQLDLIIARVKLGKRLEGVVPEVRGDGVVNVKEARHPILLLRGIEGVVGSDVEIGGGENQGLILTGPNSGGEREVLYDYVVHVFLAFNATNSLMTPLYQKVKLSS